MEQHVARGREGVARPGVKFPERMQLLRPWRSQEPVPGIRADAHDAGQARFDIPEAHGAHEA